MKLENGIEKQILQLLNIDECCTAERFSSRRNEVSKIVAIRRDEKRKNDNSETLIFVYKRFLNGGAEEECRNLKLLSGINVPNVLACSEKALCLEYIPGPTFLQMLEKCEKQNTPFDRYIHLWIEFMQHFYRTVPGYIYNDINFCNFIITGKAWDKGEYIGESVYGVDLEEIRRGRAETDIGRAAAFLLSYDPAFTEYKKQTANTFISACSDAFCIRRDDVRDEMYKEFDSMQKRRGITIKYDLVEGL